MHKEDLSMDVNDIIREMTDDTQLLILLNPNNPMGNVYSDDEFESIMKVARQKQITVLVDEAYHYFYPKTFIKYALTEDHVFITRTFSKLLCSIVKNRQMVSEECALAGSNNLGRVSNHTVAAQNLHTSPW